jgi:hypothetical protein
LGRVVAVALVAAVSPQTSCGMVSSGHSMVTVEQASLTKAESRHQRRRLFLLAGHGMDWLLWRGVIGMAWYGWRGCCGGGGGGSANGLRYGFVWSFQANRNTANLTKAGSRHPTGRLFCWRGVAVWFREVIPRWL